MKTLYFLFTFIFIFISITSCSTSLKTKKYRDPSSNAVLLSQEKCSKILGRIASFSLANSENVKRRIYSSAYAHNIPHYQKKIQILESFHSTYTADKLLISSYNQPYVSVSHMIVLLTHRANEFSKALEHFKVEGFPEINHYIEQLQNKVKIRHFERVTLDSYSQEDLSKQFKNLDIQKDILDIINRPYVGHIGELDYFFRLNKIVDSNISPGKKYIIKI